MSVTPSSQSLKRTERTRAALMGAGRDLFSIHAFDAVAIDDIVGAAGVAKGTFYNHFEDKTALLGAIVAAVRERIETLVSGVNADVEDPAARLARAMCVYVVSVIDAPVDGQILLRNDPRRSASEPLNDGLRRDLAAGLDAGRLSMPTIEAGLVYVMGVAQALLVSVVRHTDRHEPVILAQQLCTLMLRSFGIAHAEAETIASQAADEIFRLRACDPD